MLSSSGACQVSVTEAAVALASRLTGAGGGGGRINALTDSDAPLSPESLVAFTR